MIDIPGCSERTNYIFFIQTCFALSNNENSRWYMQVCLSTLKFRQHNKFPIFRRVSANGGGAGPPGPPGHGATARRIFSISSSRRVSSGSVWSLRCVTSSRHASPRRNVKRRDHVLDTCRDEEIENIYASTKWDQRWDIQRRVIRRRDELEKRVLKRLVDTSKWTTIKRRTDAIIAYLLRTLLYQIFFFWRLFHSYKLHMVLW
jgi:hypothetical protein